MPPTAQAALDAKSTVDLPQGALPISASLNASTIGQIVRGQGMAGTVGGTRVLQTTEGAKGFEFTATPDSMPPWGAGLYALQLRDLTFEALHNGTGTGVTIGDVTTPDFGGAYCTIASVCGSKFKVAFEFAGNGVFVGQMMVVQGPGVETTDSIGLLVSGGKPNSIYIAGFTGGNVDTMLRWIQPGLGNWINNGDWGACRIGADLGNDQNQGGQLTLAGGNMESTIAETIFNIRTNFNLCLIGVGGQGARTTPAIDCNGGYGRVLHIFTSIGLAGGVRLITGGLNGNTMGIEWSLAADVEYDAASIKVKDGPWRTFPGTSIPDPNANFEGSPIGVMAVIGCAGITTSDYTGLLMKTYNPATSSYGWEKLNSGNFL